MSTPGRACVSDERSEREGDRARNRELETAEEATQPRVGRIEHVDSQVE